MKKLLFLLLLSIPAYAVDWPKQIEGGLPIAMEWCATKAESELEVVVFEYSKDGERVFLTLTCKELSQIAKAVEKLETLKT